VVKSDLPLAFETTKIQSPCIRAMFNNSFLLFNSRGRESLTWFNSSQWFDSKGFRSRSTRSTRV
jgi:hypothetical protein